MKAAGDSTTAAQPRPAAGAVQYEQCGLNYFQAVAFQLNIRYAFGIRFFSPPYHSTSQHNLLTCSTVASLWYQTVAQHGAHVQIALARVPDQQPTKARPVLARQVVTSGTKLNFVPPIVEEWKLDNDNENNDDNDGLNAVVTTSLYHTNPANSGSPILTLYHDSSDDCVAGTKTNATNEQPKKNCVAMVVNLNAALWDATMIHDLVESFLQKVQNTATTTTTTTTEQQQEQEQKVTTTNQYAKLTGWAAQLPQPPTLPPSPKYLPLYTTNGDDNNDNNDECTPMAIHEILPKMAHEKEQLDNSVIGEEKPGRELLLSQRRVTLLIPTEIVEPIQAKLVAVQSSCHLSHIVMAIINWSLSETYFSSGHKNNSGMARRLSLVQSYQIDPRTMLLANQNQDDDGKEPKPSYLHAVGTLSHGRCFEESSDLMTAAANNDDDDMMKMMMRVADWIWKEARRIALDIQQRIDRGEAYVKTMELVTGQIDQDCRGPSPVAVELVDYGMLCNCHHHVEFGHRLDLCPHMSMVMHVQEKVGLKLEAQLGQDQGRTSTLKWLERCEELFELVAHHNSGVY